MEGGEHMERLTIRQARALVGLSQAEVAKKIGVSTPTYRKWEDDPERVTLKVAKQLAEIFNQPLDRVFF